MQMFFAILVGFVLVEIVSITKSLWVVIIWHATHDYIASVTSDALDRKALIIHTISGYSINICRRHLEEEYCRRYSNSW